MGSQDKYRNQCKEIVRLLKEERERRGISKYEVEQRSGVSQQMVGYVERGLRNPSLEIILRIADALEVDLGKIIKMATEAGRAKKRA